MKNNIVVRIAIFAFILTGCLKAPTPRETPGAEENPIIVSPSQTLTTQTPFEPQITITTTGTPSPTLTPSPTRTDWLKTQCLGIENLQPPAGAVVEGILFAENDNLQKLLLDLSPDNPRLTPYQPQGNPWEYAVSLDGRWLAYWEFRREPNGAPNTQWIVIIDSTGQEYTSYMDDHFHGIVRWLDNEWILVKYGAPADPWGLFVPLAALNPFTGENRVLSLDLQDVFNLNMMYRWLRQTVIVYDSSLSRLVYPRIEGEIALVNADTEELITLLTDVSLSASVPVWSPNGENFAIANVTTWEKDAWGNNYQPMIFDLYIVSRDGVVTQMTDFSEYFSQTDILAYSWSPNGRYIAFAMTGWRGDAVLPTWALLDTETHEVTNYCLQPYFYSDTARPPIWSPNGDKFVVEVDDPEDDDKKLILIDIFEGYAYQIAENITVYGWMAPP